MTETPTRRALLAGAATAALAGCTGIISDEPTDSNENDGMATPGGTDDGTETPDGTDGTPSDTLPEDCPTTQNIDVEWPEDITAESVASFVQAYENAYYREKVVDYEPESRLDDYRLEATVNGEPMETEAGFTVLLSGNGGIFRPTLHLGATTAAPPADADVVGFDAVEDETLRGVLTTAADTGSAQEHIDDTGETVERYIDIVASLSESFDPPEGPSESGTAYFDVDGTTVELTLQTDSFHGDYWWEAHYYVDENVVWRVESRSGDVSERDPKDGKLLECRTDR